MAVEVDNGSVSNEIHRLVEIIVDENEWPCYKNQDLIPCKPEVSVLSMKSHYLFIEKNGWCEIYLFRKLYVSHHDIYISKNRTDFSLTNNKVIRNYLWPYP